MVQPLIYQYYSPVGLKTSRKLTNSSRLVIREAEKLDLDWQVIPGTQIVNLSYHGHTESFYHQVPSTTTSLASFICNNKKMTSNLLKRAGVNVPRGFRIRRNHDQNYQLEVFEALSKPVVVKPSNGTWGEKVSVNIKSKKKYLAAVSQALSYTLQKNTGAVVEEMFVGDEYRILVTRDKVIGVLKRIPANVIGDGKSTIKKLIQNKNQEPIRGVKGSNKSHLKIIMDKRLQAFLTERYLSLTSVPSQGQQIFLRRVSNISQGGDAIDVTDQIHPSVAKLALKTIRTIPGLSFAGIDFMCVDISQEQTLNSYVVIEINNSPGFDVHDFPYQGKKRHAAREFIYLMFPELHN